MLNDPFVHDQANALSRRVLAVGGRSQAEQVRVAFRMALQRPPSAAEAAWSAELLDKQARRYPAKETEAAERALTHLCHMLLNTSEFLYVE